MKLCQDAISDNSECVKCCNACADYDNCTIDSKCDFPEMHCHLAVSEESEESEMTDLQVMQNTLPNAIQTITEIVRQKKALDEKEKVMKESLREAMERTGIKKFESPDLKFVYVASTTRTSIDSAKLKKKYPEIAEECSKTSEVSASVRVTLK